MTERDPASAAGGSVDEPSAPADEPQSSETSETVDESVTAAAGRAVPRSRTPGRPTTPVAVRPVRAPLSGLRQKIESTAALRESLDAKEAEAQDLRASIEQLRQELDTERAGLDQAPAVVTAAAAAAPPDTAPPTTRDPFAPAEPRRGRLPWWALVLIAVLTVLALLLLATRCSPAGDTSAGSTPSAGAAAAGSAVPDGAPTPSPMAWGGGQVVQPPDLPAGGPGIDAPGTYVMAVLDADGTSVDTYERAVFATPRSDPLVLTVPTLPNLARPALADVQVELDGVPAPVTEDADGGLTVAVPDGGSFDSAVVRYRLTDGVITWTDSKPGRVDALVLPVTGGLSTAADAPVQVQSAQPGIVGMNCYVSADQIAPPCASVAAGVWTATLPEGAERSVALITIDR